MILTYIAKTVHVLIYLRHLYLTTFIHFCTQISQKFYKLFPCGLRLESKFNLAMKISRSTQAHHQNISEQKSSNLSYVLEFFQIIHDFLFLAGAAISFIEAKPF